MYLVLHFQYTLEISLKWRRARTGIWLLIHCLLWFDVDGCRMILSIVLVGFTAKLQTGKTGLRDFAPNKKGRVGWNESTLYLMLIQKNKYILIETLSKMSIYGIFRGRMLGSFTFHTTFPACVRLSYLHSQQMFFPTMPICLHLSIHFITSSWYFSFFIWQNVCIANPIA